MPIPQELSLTKDELDDLMLTSWNMRVATIGPGTRINVTPLWFGWAEGKIFFYCRGQKVVNLRRNTTCTVLVDKNERFPELQEQCSGTGEGARRPGPGRARHGRSPLADGQAPVATGGCGAQNESSARGRHWRWVVSRPRKW
jgi:hypothetical protein